jgi:hypothetical protein
MDDTTHHDAPDDAANRDDTAFLCGEQNRFRTDRRVAGNGARTQVLFSTAL